MTTNDDVLTHIGKLIEPIKKDLQEVKQGQEQIKTTLKALEAGQHDMQEKLDKKADKVDIQNLDAKLVSKVKQHNDRLEDLEKHTGSPNRHKN